MSTEATVILEVLSPGSGRVLDLGGGKGMLRQSLEELGYRYINFDIQSFQNGELSLIGDAHALPFHCGVFEIVISKDTLEHFLQPWIVVREVYRVLKDGGRFVIWVPFMHPFHADDLYRYTPLGLKHLLSDFEIMVFDSPLWVFTVFSVPIIEVMKRLHLGVAERPIKQFCGWLDRCFTRQQTRPASFASAYRIVALKREKTKG